MSEEENKSTKEEKEDTKKSSIFEFSYELDEKEVRAFKVIKPKNKEDKSK